MRNESEEQMQSQPLDPFCITSGPLIYERAHKLNILISEKPGIVQRLPQKEELTLKIATMGRQQTTSLVCMELSSDKQLEFNFQFRCNDIEFRRIRELQKFYIQFREYPDVIIKNLQKLIQPKNQSQQHLYEANFIIYSQSLGKLEIIRKSEFKDDQIMEFQFKRSPEEHIQASVQYRYDQMRRDFNQKINKYEQYREIIKAKNPSLMMQIDKSLKLRK